MEKAMRCLSILLLTPLMIPAVAQVNVLTYRNDNLRTGANLAENVLTPANVRAGTFGKLFTLPVDGKVDAEPLIVAGVASPSQRPRNFLIVATEHATLYAFDADTGAKYWQTSLLPPGETTSDDRGCNQ